MMLEGRPVKNGIMATLTAGGGGLPAKGASTFRVGRFATIAGHSATLNMREDGHSSTRSCKQTNSCVRGD
jgi:hypothetical protein